MERGEIIMNTTAKTKRKIKYSLKLEMKTKRKRKHTLRHKCYDFFCVVAADASVIFQKLLVYDGEADLMKDFNSNVKAMEKKKKY